ncbi:ComEC/Rec2 family competence protein, partial [Candidatus Riflebacteria bacterium]
VGTLRTPMKQNNPGGFDFGRYLKNRGIYACIYNIKDDEKIKILEKPASSNRLYEVALKIKATFLDTLKKTLPYPESAFLGGVTLGLRRGLPERVNMDFKKTGVSHVLAVSGLHITIIAVMFYGLFLLTPIDKRIFTPIIILFLFVFAMIVGWPPSAVRAAVMNSLTLLFLAYFKDMGFKSSVIFALSIAGFYILITNPLLLLEPSFTLSFMAILSLVLLTGPFETLLYKVLVGKGFFLGVAAFLTFYLSIAFNPRLTTHPYFFAGAVIYIFGTLLLAYFLSLQEKEPEKVTWQFKNGPRWLTGFSASQFAILFGMMAPLSAVYFNRLSISSPVANFIAIPLITLIVQIGLIAYMIGSYIPFVGIYIALVLNGANWLLVKFFLLTTATFSAIFPYPYICQPTSMQIIFYYAILVIFIFSEPILLFIRERIRVIWVMTEIPRVRFRLVLMGISCFALLYYCGMFLSANLGVERDDLRMTVLDVGFSTAVQIETQKHQILIDCGEGGDTKFSSVETTVFPYILSRRRNFIDLMVLSSAESHHISGTFKLIKNFRIGKLLHPFSLINPELSFEGYLRLRDIKRDGLKFKPLIVEEWHYYKKFCRLVKKYKIPNLYCEKSFSRKYGEVLLYAQNINGALAVSLDYEGNRYAVFSDHFKFGVKKYGKLFGGKSNYEAVVLPNHGLHDFALEDLLTRLKPNNIVLSSKAPYREGPILFSPALFLESGIKIPDFLEIAMESEPFKNWTWKNITNTEQIRNSLNPFILDNNSYSRHQKFFKALLASTKKDPKKFNEVFKIEKLLNVIPRTDTQNQQLNRSLLELTFPGIFISTNSYSFKKHWYLARNYRTLVRKTKNYLAKIQFDKNHIFETNAAPWASRTGACVFKVHAGETSSYQHIDKDAPDEVSLPKLINPFEGKFGGSSAKNIE